MNSAGPPGWNNTTSARLAMAARHACQAVACALCIFAASRAIAAAGGAAAGPLGEAGSGLATGALQRGLAPRRGGGNC